VEAGKLSVVTQDGQPIFMVVPFDEILVREGVNVALAIKLFDEETISLGKAARLAGMSVVEFMDCLTTLPTLDRGEAEVIALALEVKLDGTEQGRICIPAQPRAKGNTVIQNVREVCCNSLLAIRDRWISASMPKCHSVGLPQYR